MTTYKSIVGQKILKVSSDPTNPLEGQIWYNSSTGILKGVPLLEAWSSGTVLTTKRYISAGTGSATAGLVSGGDTGGDTKTGATEEYNGNGWSNGGTMNTPRAYVAGAGTQTASLGFSGYTYPPPNPSGS